MVNYCFGLWGQAECGCPDEDKCREFVQKGYVVIEHDEVNPNKHKCFATENWGSKKCKYCKVHHECRQYVLRLPVEGTVIILEEHDEV